MYKFYSSNTHPILVNGHASSSISFLFLKPLDIVKQNNYFTYGSF